jgi:hypothetical protein
MKTTEFQGMKIRIDRPKGFEQTGVGDDGKPWKRVYTYDYGFLPKTKGGDGDGVDVFLGPDKDAHTAFWAIQKDKQGKFDEYKVFLGFPTRAAAKAAYIKHIPSKYLGDISAMSVQMMRALLGYEPFEKMASALPGDTFEKVAFLLAFTTELGTMPEEAA